MGRANRTTGHRRQRQPRGAHGETAGHAGPLARHRTDAGRWRCQRRRRFPRGNWSVRDRRQSGVLYVHHRRYAPRAILAENLFDLERMLFDGNADVALGFHVETGV